MVAVYPILTLLVIFALSLLVIRIGAVSLRMTGLSPEVASFQATSAFSGAGFTTEEAEDAVATPGRRRIVEALIRLGSIGLVSVIASLVLSFTRTEGGNALGLTYIVVGAGLIVLIARSRWFNQLLTPIIEWGLQRTTDLEIRDYARLLGLEGAYRVAEIDVGPEDWLADETPASIDLGAEGVLVLGIGRGDDTYVGAPGPNTEIRPGDTLVVYGREGRLQELAEREEGDTEAHDAAVEEHEQVIEAQARRAGWSESSTGSS